MVAGRAKVSFYLPPREQGVFWLQAGRGCLSTYHRGAGSFLVAGRAKVSIYLPPPGDGSFLVAGRARVSLYLPPRGWEFLGCRRGEGVSLPTAAGARSRKTPTPREGWAVMGDCGRIIGAKRILYERNVGGLNNLVLAQEEQ